MIAANFGPWNWGFWQCPLISTESPVTGRLLWYPHFHQPVTLEWKSGVEHSEQPRWDGQEDLSFGTPCTSQSCDFSFNSGLQKLKTHVPQAAISVFDKNIACFSNCVSWLHISRLQGHVGYAIPTELFPPFVSGSIEVIRSMTTVARHLSGWNVIVSGFKYSYVVYLRSETFFSKYYQLLYPVCEVTYLFKMISSYCYRIGWNRRTIIRKYIEDVRRTTVCNYKMWRYKIRCYVVYGNIIT